LKCSLRFGLVSICGIPSEQLVVADVRGYTKANEERLDEGVKRMLLGLGLGEESGMIDCTVQVSEHKKLLVSRRQTD
jgi:hypothetical protein